MSYVPLSPIPSKYFEITSKCENPEIQTVNILMLGDSINRLMAEEYCLHFLGALQSWGSGFSYERGAPSAKICQKDNFRIAYINVYGSAPEGPYLHGHTNTEADPNADTKLRIPEGIKQYVELFGEPTHVIYRTDLWDLQPRTRYLNHSKAWHAEVNEDAEVNNATAIMEEYVNNHMWAHNMIRSLLPNAYIGSHTIPPINWGMHLFHQYQNALRYLSASTDAFLFDWGLLMLPHLTTDYLRDFHHPDHLNVVSFAKIMIDSLKYHLCTLRPAEFLPIENGLITGPGRKEYYYLKFGYKRLLLESTAAFFKVTSPSTMVYELTQKQLDSIPIGPPCCNNIVNDVLILPAGTKLVYWLVDGVKRPISGPSAFFQHGWDFDNVTHLTVSASMNDMELVPEGPYV
jgi:hypothetical protein